MSLRRPHACAAPPRSRGSLFLGSTRVALTVLAASAALVLTGCGAPVLNGTTAPAPTPTVGSPSTPASSPSPETSTAPSPTATTPSASATPKPAPSPTPSTAAALLSKGDKGDQVRELQHRLLQLDWYSGAISGTYGTSTVDGVKGFQDKRKIDDTGAVDQKTWDTLTGMTKKPTRDQMYNVLRAGPAILKQGSTGDQVRELQARLKQIGWHSGKITDTYGTATVANVKGFQGKRAIPVTGEVDQRTWDRLGAMTREPTKDEKNNVAPKVAKPSAAGLDSRCLTGRALCISKTTNQLVWVVDGKPQIRVDVRFGSQELPTREGAFSVGWKSRDHVSTIYHTPMPFAMFFSGGQAVHYSPDFAARGYNGASHGCVNVRDRAAIETLFNTVSVGDKVIVYRS